MEELLYPNKYSLGIQGGTRGPRPPWPFKNLLSNKLQPSHKRRVWICTVKCRCAVKTKYRPKVQLLQRGWHGIHDSTPMSLSTIYLWQGIRGVQKTDEQKKPLQTDRTSAKIFVRFRFDFWLQIWMHRTDQTEPKYIIILYFILNI